MSDNTLTLHGDGSATLSADRLTVTLECCWELESLAQVLPSLVPCTADSGPAHFAVRGIADRIRRLSCAAMSALSDDLHPLEDLQRTVLGCASSRPGLLPADNTSDPT